MARRKLSPREIFDRDHAFQKPEELQLEILYQLYRSNSMVEKLADNLRLIVNVFIVLPLALSLVFIALYFLNTF
jgi:hypothetical protein